MAVTTKPVESRNHVRSEQTISRGRDTLRPEEKQTVVNVLSSRLAFVNNSVALELQTTSSLGAKDSAHDVFFARSVAKDPHGQRNIYACKRFRRSENAERELQAMQEAQNRGFTTLEPVGDGIYPVDSIGHILVTKHMPRFTTMNQIGWQDYFVGQPEYDSRITPSLESIALFVAHMHRQGIIHDDLQLKNIGIVPPAQSVLFDLEGASFFEPVSETSPPSFDHLGKTMHDVSTLVNSLVDRGFLWDSTDQVFAGEVTDHLLMPYLLNANMHPAAVIEDLDSIVDHAQDLRHQVHGQLVQATA